MTPSRPRGPRAQRELHPPTTRPRARSAVSGDHQAWLVRRLTPRDRWLIRMLHEHRVLTTRQITLMAYPSVQAARHRLLELHQWDVVDRFQPFVGVGTAPRHYVLGAAGAAVLAAEEGITTAALGYRRDDVLGIAHRHTLAHTVAVNDVFADLVHQTTTNLGADPAATDPGVRLVSWWSETRCLRQVGDLARPDAYGRIIVSEAQMSRRAAESLRAPDPRRDAGESGGARAFEWFFELDFGTEPLARVAAKLDGYLQLAAATHPTPLLIWLPTPAREAHAREHLAQALRRLERPDLVPIATSTPAVTPAATPAVPPGRAPADDDVGVLGWLPITLERRQPDHGRTHHAGSGRAGAATGPRCGLADLAALWPAAHGQSHAELAAPDHTRARTRTMELPAPDPVPPAPTPTTPAPSAPAPTPPGPTTPGPPRPRNPHGAAHRAPVRAADRAVRPAATGHGHPGRRRT